MGQDLSIALESLIINISLFTPKIRTKTMYFLAEPPILLPFSYLKCFVFPESTIIEKVNYNSLEQSINSGALNPEMSFIPKRIVIITQSTDDICLISPRL